MEELVLIWFKYDPWVLWPIAALVVVVVIQVWFYLRYLGEVARESKQQCDAASRSNGAKPGVSVIICAHDNANDLERHLPFIFEQDYPEYQVIVVNDASTDHTNDVLQRFESHTNFYHTFVPPGVRSISSRKMAMTIGIKAAMYDYVLFMDPAGVPAGNQWLASMMRQVDDEAGIVLGYASTGYTRGFWHKLLAYDALFSVMQYLGLALKQKPYRGHPSNLAFRKELFFSQKGFSSHLFLQSGADDLLIGELATPTNVRVELNPESFVHVEKETSWLAWKNELLNHFATSGMYNPGVRFLLLLESWSRFLFYVLMTALLVLTLIKSFYAWLAVTGALLLTRFIVQGMVISKTAQHLEAGPSKFFFPLYDVLIPLVKLYFRLTNRSSKGNAYTWEVLR